MAGRTATCKSCGYFHTVKARLGKNDDYTFCSANPPALDDGQLDHLRPEVVADDPQCRFWVNNTQYTTDHVCSDDYQKDSK